LQIGRGSSPRPLRVQECRADDDELAACAPMGLTTHEPLARQARSLDLDFHRRVVDAILESTTDAILVVSLDGRIVDYNQRFVDTWGIPPEVMATGLSSSAVAFVRDQLADGAEFEERVAWLYSHPLDESHEEIAFRDGRLLERWSRPVTDDAGKANGRMWLFRDISEQRRANTASDILALSSELFGSPLNVEKTLSQLAEMVVPKMADWAAVDILDEYSTFRRVGVAHVEPGGARLLRDLHQRYPLRTNEGHLRGRVLATLEPIALYDVDDAELRSLARDDEHFEMLRGLGLRSAIWVPLTVRGHVLGVLSVGYGEGNRRYTSFDLGLLRELARRAALALDNALLYRAVERAEVRQAALATLGQQALAWTGYHKLAQMAADSLARVMEVPFVEVLDLNPDRRELLLVAGVGWRAGQIGEATVKAGLGSQGGYTLTTVGPVLVEDLLAEKRFTPPPLLVDHGVVGGVTVVIGSPANPYGVLGTHTSERRAFAEDDVNFIQAVANVLAATRERQDDDERLTALATAEQARAAQLKGVIESIGDAVVVCDALGSIVLSNPAAGSLLGAHLGSGLAGIMRAFAWPDGRQAGELAPGQGVELRLDNEQDTETWVELSAFPILSDDDNAGSGGTILVLRDATASRNARAVRDAFLGVLSHELRTPVTTIYGSSELLSRKSAGQMSDERRREVYDDIRSEADRLYRLVENLLVISRVERQGLTIDTEPVLIQRLIPRVVESESARWPNAAWKTDLPSDLPPVAAEETYIEQVLRNLLSNAAKYGGDGPVSVTAHSTGRAVAVTVRDSGPGFPEDESRRLFDLFYRSPAAVRRAAGAGIGLFVSRQLVSAMGGWMTARNLPEGGAEFMFELPIFGL
jgi:PAS domain S-box-containing protein